MIKVVSSAEMREMDRYTIEELGIPGAVLMENAGSATSRVILRALEKTEHPLVYIFCGKGNNGGDGFVIARYLWDAGIAVQVIIIGKESDIKGDAAINYRILNNMQMPLTFAEDATKLEENLEEMPDLIVDALLGTGIKGEVYGGIKTVIDFMNDLACPVVSVDIPSGLNSDTPEAGGSAVTADITVTMALPKKAHLFYPARKQVGELFIANIGIPFSVRNNPEVKLQVVEKSDIFLPVHAPDAHKYRNGKVAVIAGSVGLTGAAALTSEAALRIGAGMIRLAVPGTLNPVLETKLTEVITFPYGNSASTFLMKENLSDLQELLEWCDVLAIGPGLGRDNQTIEAVLQILEDFKKPAVIDADALFAVSRKQGAVNYHPEWILTPHHGEFSRLLDQEKNKRLKFEFVELAQEFAGNSGVILLLKGAPSITVNEQKEVFINPTGNSGLASGGTGDVLTGFVAGLLAQGLPPQEAAITANYLHGLTADHVAKEHGTGYLTAGDLIRELGRTLQQEFYSED
ncbi:MAG: NAD(P)H-hydrate dehydratase [Calditrichia bacterium]